MSLGQPSRTIVVEPVQAATPAPPPAEAPPRERVDEPAATARPPAPAVAGP